MGVGKISKDLLRLCLIQRGSMSFFKLTWLKKIQHHFEPERFEEVTSLSSNVKIIDIGETAATIARESNQERELFFRKQHADYKT
jgi:hypothetical protein